MSMRIKKPRCIIVTSTAGSVMNEVLKNTFFKSLIHSVIADRICPAVDKAKLHGIPTYMFAEPNRDRFCQRLLEYLNRNKINYIFSHYMKTYTDRLRRAYRDRIINLHIALLPSFKGYDGFNDAVRYGVKFVGSTVELIDKKMDEGKIIMQTVCPLDLTQKLSFTRHRIFVQQCKSLLQVAKWLADGRIKIDGRQVTIIDAKFADFEFSPSLDFEDAIRLQIPYSRIENDIHERKNH